MSRIFFRKVGPQWESKKAGHLGRSPWVTRPDRGGRVITSRIRGGWCSSLDSPWWLVRDARVSKRTCVCHIIYAPMV